MIRKIFQPDLFSTVKPAWHPLNAELESALKEVQDCLPGDLPMGSTAPLQSAAFGINSSNFKLATPDGDYLLKRWSPQTGDATISKTLSLITWLASNNIPAPVPLRFRNGEPLLRVRSGRWSVFPFIAADYFNGSGDQLGAAAQITGDLMGTLSRLPSALVPERGPEHLTVADGKMFCRAEATRNDWEQIFGTESTVLLEEYWDEVMAEWRRLISKRPTGGRLQASHYDLHPHNLLFSGNTVAAVLDFESCRVMPAGYALGFAALKQCRQTVSLHQGNIDIRSIGAFYMTLLVGSNREAALIAHEIGDLAICEVLRRINLILRLNIEERNRAWNHVLQIQLGHIREAKQLFN